MYNIAFWGHLILAAYFSASGYPEAAAACYVVMNIWLVGALHKKQTQVVHSPGGDS